MELSNDGGWWTFLISAEFTDGDTLSFLKRILDILNTDEQVYFVFVLFSAFRGYS